jgi:hypothetical protein
VTPRTETQIETISGFRRVVALLALAAWTSGAFSCPLPDDDADTAPSRPAHSHADGQPLPHPDSDECCRVLSQTHAIVQGLTTPSFKTTAPSFLVLIAAAVPLLATSADPVAKLTPVSHGPPRSGYLRFATFWSHAPPTDHA